MQHMLFVSGGRWDHACREMTLIVHSTQKDMLASSVLTSSFHGFMFDILVDHSLSALVAKKHLQGPESSYN